MRIQRQETFFQSLINLKDKEEGREMKQIFRAILWRIWINSQMTSLERVRESVIRRWEKEVWMFFHVWCILASLDYSWSVVWTIETSRTRSILFTSWASFEWSFRVTFERESCCMKDLSLHFILRLRVNPLSVRSEENSERKSLRSRQGSIEQFKTWRLRCRRWLEWVILTWETSLSKQGWRLIASSSIVRDTSINLTSRSKSSN